MVETSWTGDIRVNHRPRYDYIIYVALYLLPLLYDDDALIIQLGKVEFNS